MVKVCVCAGCTNSNSPRSGHRVHSFPKKSSPAFRAWVRFVQIKRADFTASSVQPISVVCGAHFKTEDYVQGDVMEHRMGFRSLDRIRLLPDAVPSIQTPDQSSGSAARPSTVVNKLGLSRVSVSAFYVSSSCKGKMLFNANMDKNTVAARSFT